MPMTIEQFGRGLVSAGIMTPTELKEWWTAQGAEGRPKDGDHFAELLRGQGKLSDYQSKVLLAGKPNALAFDKYVFIEQIGKGGMGAVFKARRKSDGRYAAIKVLSPEATKDEKAVKRFQREVEAAGKLEHPHIVHAFDSGEFNGQHYLAMDYVDGADLASIVKDRGPFSVAKAINYTLQAAQGLRFAHEQGVIHRDIKPSNILLDKSGQIRILDLGLVRFEGASDGLTATQQVMGTIDYMAPEQVANTKLADARCDVYSLGVTLWILLTGKKLYDAKNMVDRVMMHREAPIPLVTEQVPDAPKGLDEVLQKMLAKQATERYQSMAEVCAALEQVLQGAKAPAASRPAAPQKSPAKPAAAAATKAEVSSGDTASAPTISVKSSAELSQLDDATISVPKLTEDGPQAVSIGDVSKSLKAKGKQGVRGVRSKSDRKRAKALMAIYIGIIVLVMSTFGGLMYVFM